jgi:capsular exopolysaccharide synthesis family protein
MVTSSLPGEGKTTTVENLAFVMKDLKNSVLIIDLDLRKPSVHKRFNLSNKCGLTDLLLNKDDYKHYINNVYPGVDVITSGRIPSNPPEVINSKAIKELIKELSSHYDYIFVDTPPVAMVSDPITIATITDAVVLTVAHGEIVREVAKKTVDSLRQVNANILGIVLNKLPIGKENYYYYYYSYK